jgi:hypothetical protein
VRVPAALIEDPGSLLPPTILGEQNLEVRRAMIERIGYEQFLATCGAQPVAQDEHGRLWRVAIPDDEPLVVVEVRNATLESDGSRKTHFLRVPPQTRNPHEAVSWTFGIDADAYRLDAAT